MEQTSNQSAARGGTEVSAAGRFNERSFLRRARAISFLRALVVSFAVAVTVIVGLFVGTEMMLQRQENRIDSLYPDLIRLTRPNTVALAGKSYDLRLFGRQKEYYLFRLLGDRPLPAGDVTVDFDVWGGEQTLGDETFCVLTASTGDGPAANVSAVIPAGAKEYTAPLAVPVLRFYYPVRDGDKILREFGALRTLSGDALVEMAVSFKQPLTYDEVRSAIPNELILTWGAVCAFPDSEYLRAGDYLTANRMVGNPYMQDARGEQDFMAVLKRLSDIPGHHAGTVKRTLDFLKANGVRYYGAVVVGPARAVAKLEANPMVTAAVLGMSIPAP